LDESSYSLIVIGGLLILHAIIVAADAALSHHRQSIIRDRAEDEERSAQRVVKLNATPARVAISTHITLTLIKFALASTTIDGLLPAIARESGIPTLPVAAALALLAGLALTGYLLSDLLPSTIGRTRADHMVTSLAPLLQALVWLLAPLVYLFTRLERWLAQMSGGEDLSKAIIEEEIIDLVESSEREGALEEEERDMIRSVLEFDETMVREIMVPRLDITAVEVQEPLREALRLVIESGHSRIPVYEDEIDDIKGLVYAKDLLAALYRGNFDNRTIRELMRPAYFVPETKRAEDLFREFQTTNTQLAIVVDEFGSTAGVISVEDIVEEIVGDIRDEYDTTETVEYTQHSTDDYTVDASINLYDFNRLFDTDLPTDDNDSLGGYLYAHFGRVPEIGAEMRVEDLQMRVESVEGVRIRNVRVARLSREATASDANNPPQDTPAPVKES
jgi:CBS domain containing-hemolysin-like protein